MSYKETLSVVTGFAFIVGVVLMAIVVLVVLICCTMTMGRLWPDEEEIPEPESTTHTESISGIQHIVVI